MSTNNVQNTHILRSLPELHRSLIDIASVLNRPENDAALLEKAGLALERALFPLLVFIQRLGPIGVVDLAGRVGRDHTTVSRQVARLEELGLVERRAGQADRRVREAVVTAKGRAATDALDAARGRMAVRLFEDWSPQDFDDLVRLMRKFADGMSGMTEENG
jgi:DNA-binding MarR family transcriptional regulator